MDMDQASQEFQPRVLARREPERLAFRMCDTGQDVTFAQLEARANQGAHLLRVCGVGVGDHIMVLMEKQFPGKPSVGHQQCWCIGNAVRFIRSAGSHELLYVCIDWRIG